ncbi:DUF7079 family protein [Aeromonas veronii]|uniref:DUF7079 family protein n=1 Tax=Aeromonas veronii TaxID=654 RepID=UPI002B479CCA|nr:hypothetical protein [Aeromonas veronii]
MKGTRSDIELCEALSGFFVDNEVDYRYIAKVAKAFPIEHVEKVLFEWVAPVCYTNMLTPVPEIWSGFERDFLWREIQNLREEQAKGGMVRKVCISLRQVYLRWQFSDEWRKLRRLLVKQ